MLQHDGTNAFVRPTNAGGLYLGSNNQTRISISSAGLTTVNQSLTVGKNLIVTGNTTLGDSGAADKVTINGGTTLNHSLSIGNNLTVSGNTTLGNSASADKVTITGGVTLNQSLAISKNLTVTGNNAFSGISAFSGTINSAGANILSQTLTDGATITWNTALGQIATVTLGGNRTMAAPTNLKVGTYILRVYQDATGSRSLTWNGVFKWTAAVAPVLTTTGSRLDVVSFYSDGTNLYGSYLPDMR